MPNLKTLMKIAPTSKGIVQTAVTGIGSSAVLQTLDNFAGAPVQRFGFVLPVLNIRLSGIDIANYLIHSGGKIKLSKKGAIAVLAAKFVQGSVSLSGLTSLGANSQAGNILNVGGANTARSGPPGGGI